MAGSIKDLDSTEFEQRVGEIVELLKGRGATVTWNAHLPDPDSPKRMRQVDITLQEGAELTVIECRHRSRPQDVMWIEELMGRRISLGAGQVIAVSSSGFTEGAIRKAERHGVFLRELSDVTDAEARAWGTRFNIALEYIHLSDVVLHPVCGERIALPAPLHELDFFTDAGNAWPVNHMLATMARRVPDAGVREGPIVLAFTPQGLRVGSRSVSELLVQMAWSIVRREQVLPALARYGAPGTREVRLESSQVSQTAVMASESALDVVIDATVASFSPDSILFRAQVNSPGPLKMRSAAILGLQTQFPEPLSVRMEPLLTHSRKYRDLSKRCGQRRIRLFD